MPSAIDKIDKKIGSRWQGEGRISNQDLADRSGLSPSPCLRRVRSLETSGVIKGYVALLNPAELGLGVTAFVRVRLREQGDRHLAEFETAVATIAEVMDCYLMTGESDYLLRVLVSSLAAFEEMLRLKITSIPGVAEVTTSFALRPVVQRTDLPLDNHGRDRPSSERQILAGALEEGQTGA